jgi:hypothetical protein
VLQAAEEDFVACNTVAGGAIYRFGDVLHLGFGLFNKSKH